MTVVLTAAGLLLILTALRDIFDTLFHPEGKGTLGRLLMRGSWNMIRGLARRRPQLFQLAGPVSLLSVIGSWAFLLLLGWTLVYLPHMPGEFEFTSGRTSDFVDAAYVSLVTLTTLGFGDVVPEAGWLRLVAPVEGLLGFGLLSASIAWLLGIWPVVARRRALAYEVNLLRDAEAETGVSAVQADSGAAERIFNELTSRIVAVERDFAMFPISYYFAEADDRFALPTALPYLLELAGRGSSDDLPDNVRLRATMLREAVDDFAAMVAKRFHRDDSEDTARLIAAYKRDHLR
jgi:Ion channel